MKLEFAVRMEQMCTAADPEDKDDMKADAAKTVVATVGLAQEQLVTFPAGVEAIQIISVQKRTKEQSVMVPFLFALSWKFLAVRVVLRGGGSSPQTFARHVFHPVQLQLKRGAVTPFVSEHSKKYIT